MLDYSLVYAVVGIALTCALLSVLSPDRRALDGIPTVGPSAPLASYIGAIRWLYDAPRMVQEGYDKYKGRAFKVANIDRWMVIVSGPKLIDEVRRAPDDVLSFTEATNDMLSIDYTLSPNVHHNEYHIPIVRSQLTRSLTSIFPEVRDEVITTFDEIIAPKGDEWIALPALETIMQVVCRASNRVFVGLPVCRNKDYCEANVRFAVDVMASAILLNMFPKFLRPVVGNMLTLVPRTVRRVRKHLEPLIEERLAKMEEYGDEWTDRPNDMLQWLLKGAEGNERTVDGWTRRMMVINFAAIHTSSMSFTIALFHLAANPEAYLQPMREEVETVTKEEGWSKASMQKMRKLDSFLRESQRLTGLDALALNRKVMKPFMLSDGTRLPIGTHIACAAMCTHSDNENYVSADVFDGFRFANMREEDGESIKYQFVSTSTDYVPFGHGRHACPGRFFAAAELKAMLAHLVINYDVKLEDEGVRPKDTWFSTSRSPNRTAKVMFRKRHSRHAT
ncbi:cytochrome P450 [Gloeophyllum trabeum ATCC 11539]|uniref:Cytochrome P450 n=1 Tax=Gloeophyllum trabeum (strain ATCC 11539 / FP-39264 / Madison 617) TaxID=670483 RepID=S7S3S4_GLOTA|nr:cytochrome P450 [Gloeophyllum trabeum ATCC 11539]EPQ60474.1 cytochrome P450 [Gloeophyllum trabeum ATCC 11539]